MAKSKASVVKSERQWQIEQDARTLVEAEKIKMDKSRFRPVLSELKKQSNIVSNVVRKKRKT